MRTTHASQEEEILYSEAWTRCRQPTRTIFAASAPDPLDNQDDRYPLLADYVSEGGERTAPSSSTAARSARWSIGARTALRCHPPARAVTLNGPAAATRSQADTRVGERHPERTDAAAEQQTLRASGETAQAIIAADVRWLREWHDVLDIGLSAVPGAASAGPDEQQRPTRRHANVGDSLIERSCPKCSVAPHSREATLSTSPHAAKLRD